MRQVIAELRRRVVATSQVEVAATLDISPAFLCRILNGERKPNAKVLRRLGLRRVTRLEPTNGR
jgi:predicted transcriptional regulator